MLTTEILYLKLVDALSNNLRVFKILKFPKKYLQFRSFELSQKSTKQ